MKKPIIDFEVRNKIAQTIVNMHVGERRPITKREMLPYLKEVNDSQIINHALRFIKDAEGTVTHVAKYRKTEVEKRYEQERLELIRNEKDL